VCHGWGTQRICGQCVLRFATEASRCEWCALQVPMGVSVCGACLADPPPFERSVAAVDYAFPWDSLITRFKFHGALDLAPALARCLADAVVRGRTPRPSLLLPVPLSDARLLLRTRDTPHQLAFAVEPQRSAELHGRTVAIVDDVMTIGAMAAEITRVLLQAGAAQVQVWSVARTPRPGEA
jgi:predicted amidophosphoribosyltransferase